MCPMAGVVAIRMRAICLPPSSAQALDDLGDGLFSLAAAETQVGPQDLPEQHVGCRHQLRESNLPVTGVEAREDAGKRPVDPSRMLPSTVLGHFSNHGQAVSLRGPGRWRRQTARSRRVLAAPPPLDRSPAYGLLGLLEPGWHR